MIPIRWVTCWCSCVPTALPTTKNRPPKWTVESERRGGVRYEMTMTEVVAHEPHEDGIRPRAVNHDCRPAGHRDPPASVPVAFADEQTRAPGRARHRRRRAPSRARGWYSCPSWSRSRSPRGRRSSGSSSAPTPQPTPDDREHRRPSPAARSTAPGRSTPATHGNFVRYRVTEQLVAGVVETDATGRTDDVTGTMTIDGTTVSGRHGHRRPARPQSDKQLPRRDASTTRRARVRPVPEGEVRAHRSRSRCRRAPRRARRSPPTATGDFTLHGVTQAGDDPARGPLGRQGRSRSSASLPIAFADYGITAPNIGGGVIGRRPRRDGAPALLHAEPVDRATGAAVPSVDGSMEQLAALRAAAHERLAGRARATARARSGARSRSGSSAPASTATSRRTPTTTRRRTSRARTRPGSASSRRCCATRSIVESADGDVVGPGTIVEIRIEGDDEPTSYLSARSRSATTTLRRAVDLVAARPGAARARPPATTVELREPAAQRSRSRSSSVAPASTDGDRHGSTSGRSRSPPPPGVRTRSTSPGASSHGALVGQALARVTRRRREQPVLARSRPARRRRAPTAR